MTITIGSATFDNVFYDQDVDVLYLHVGDPSTAVDFDESPEGHALRFDVEGRLVGVTIVYDIVCPEKDRVRASGLNDDPAGGVLDGAPDRLVIVWGRDARRPAEAAANL